MSTILTAVISALISTVIGAVVGGAITLAKSRTKKEIQQEKAERAGVQCLLRSQLLEFHDKYTGRGYCPSYAKEAIIKEYQAYHDLGGNGLITKFYEDVMSLPEKPPENKGTGSKQSNGGKNT